MIDGEPTLTDKFFLAAPSADWEHGTPRRVEPDLYVKFASSDQSPESVLSLANTYGLLGKPNNRAQEAHQPFRTASSDPSLAAALVGERAIDWIHTIGSLKHLIRKGTSLQKAELQRFVDWYNWDGEGALDFRLTCDLGTGDTSCELVASTLAALLRMQWGIARSTKVTWRQCAECTNFISVHPDSNRSDRRYCSDACRMRAYRRRKTPVR
jgi:hypothetical protein